MVKRILRKIIANSNLYKYSNNRVVFVFHDISEAAEIQYSSQYSTKPDDFRQMVDFIEKKFAVVGIDDIVANNNLKSNKPFAAITFDDGFYSTFKIAYPDLVSRRMPFTVFVNKRAVTENRLWFTDMEINKSNDAYWDYIYQNCIDKLEIKLETLRTMPVWEVFNYVKESEISKLYVNNGLLRKHDKIFCDAGDLKEMVKSGIVNISSHSSNHYALSKCSSQISFDELASNKAFIESITNIHDKHMALPFGKKEHYNSRVVEQCENLGYNYVYSTSPDSYNMDQLDKRTNVIPRIEIGNENLESFLFRVNISVIKKHSI